jgi:hypothetical protein
MITSIQNTKSNSELETKESKAKKNCISTKSTIRGQIKNLQGFLEGLINHLSSNDLTSNQNSSHTR